MKKACTLAAVVSIAGIALLFVALTVVSLDQGLLGALSTVSALLVAAVLMPFVQLYHLFSGDQEKHMAAMAGLRARLDPIYAERIVEIKSRDPLADALELQGRGVLTVLPSVPGIRFYPGLMHPTRDLTVLVAGLEDARRDKLFVHLEQLMSSDPREAQEEKAAGVIYVSQVSQDFIKVGADYKERFNQAMYEARLKKEPTSR